MAASTAAAKLWLDHRSNSQSKMRPRQEPHPCGQQVLQRVPRRSEPQPPPGARGSRAIQCTKKQRELAVPLAASLDSILLRTVRVSSLFPGFCQAVALTRVGALTWKGKEVLRITCLEGNTELLKQRSWSVDWHLSHAFSRVNVSDSVS